MSQFIRVSKAARNKYMTLRQLESAIYKQFGIYDSQAAISARLRDTSRLAAIGLVKKVTIRVINNKRVWFYRLFKL